MTRTILIRIDKETLKFFKRVFKRSRGEPSAHYMARLEAHYEELLNLKELNDQLIIN